MVVALELSGGKVRIWLAVLVLLTIGLEAAAAQAVANSACEEKNPDPTYCRDGKPRPVCLDNGHLIWRDTQDALSRGEITFLTMGGKVPQRRCSDKP
jgi:hypothetical protein